MINRTFKELEKMNSFEENLDLSDDFFGLMTLIIFSIFLINFYFKTFYSVC